ncbi:hypothetical protein PF010_g1544 [Phytophthora fragariae]|uniref:Uncharacterized protein n=1 Tax=Phytophthora fragariae TaxID=53985 RepID=A0A6G0LZQ1_9STRA|nr:hypothetical protein PF010_g1544 [Phytophthora fragariae]
MDDGGEVRMATDWTDERVGEDWAARTTADRATRRSVIRRPLKSGIEAAESALGGRLGGRATRRRDRSVENLPRRAQHGADDGPGKYVECLLSTHGTDDGSGKYVECLLSTHIGRTDEQTAW